MYRSPRTTWTLRSITAVVAIALVADVGGRSAPADDQDTKVESFLARLGLTDLQILHLEKAGDRAPAGSAKHALARRLADLYAERLLEISDDDAQYTKLVERVESLIAAVPQADTPALQVMLLQADYNRAESYIIKWINDRNQTSALADATKILEQIAPLLERLRQQLSEDVDDMFAEVDRIENKDDRAAKEHEINRLQAVVARATYFTGWANYYFGVGQSATEAAQSQFQKARAAFRALFDIQEDDKYDEINPEWLGLESIWRSRALVGLGLCEAALQDLPASRACFRLLEDISTPPEIRDQGAFWYLQGLLNSGLLAEASEYAQAQVEKYSGGATKGKVDFCIALIRSGFSADKEASPQNRQLGELGIHGLARLRELDVLRLLMTKYNIRLTDESGFYLTWIKGQQQYYQAEQSDRAEDYRTAASTLTTALDQPDARKDLASAAECRNTLAMCRFRLGEYEAAALEFKLAAAALKEAGRTTAVKAAWNAFLAYRKLTEKEERFVRLAVDVLESIKRNFPNSEEATMVDYQIAVLRRSSKNPAETIRSLSEIKPNDPNYLAARYELCVLYHQQWSAARNDPQQAAEAADKLYDAVDKYLVAAQREADVEQQIKPLLWAVDVALRNDQPDIERAKSLLARAEPMAEKLGQDPLAAEYHFKQFLIAKKTGAEISSRRHAAWLTTNAPGTTYERSALITMATAADEAVIKAEQSGSAAEVAAARSEAAEKYRRLVELVGDSTEAIGANKNARVANSKLAAYDFDLGQFRAAADRLEQLLAAYPTSQDYLRRAALAHYQAGAIDQSLNHWRTLLTALPNGAADWYEAKYYQLKCLLRSDKASAQNVYEQFKLLHPDVKVEPWRTKFNELQREFS